MRLPSCYEDLDVAYRGKLTNNQTLNAAVPISIRPMRVNGGIRFLTTYRISQLSQSSAASELAPPVPVTVLLQNRDAQLFPARCHAPAD
jgi:hypothetical protein